jgi:osmotically-inducible protein OsmY
VNRSDWTIRFEICDRLVAATGLDSAGVYVSVRSGLVCLSGHVTTRRDHDAVLRIAASVDGVRGIDDHLGAEEPEGLLHWTIPEPRSH